MTETLVYGANMEQDDDGDYHVSCWMKIGDGPWQLHEYHLSPEEGARLLIMPDVVRDWTMAMAKTYVESGDAYWIYEGSKYCHTVTKAQLHLLGKTIDQYTNWGGKATDPAEKELTYKCETCKDKQYIVVEGLAVNCRECDDS